MHVRQELESFYLGSIGIHAFLTEESEIPHLFADARKKKLVNAKSTVPDTRTPENEASRSVLLILEDFDNVRGQFASHFTSRGFDVISSATLRDALAIAREEQPKAVLIDYAFSGESSAHATELLRAALPLSYIILVGGPDTVGVKDRAVHAGATLVLPKSYDLLNFEDVVLKAQHH